MFFMSRELVNADILCSCKTLLYAINNLNVGMTRKCHTHTLQTSPRHHEIHKIATWQQEPTRSPSIRKVSKLELKLRPNTNPHKLWE